MMISSRSKNKEKGRTGELLVDAWLKKEGWSPAIANYFFKGGEVDRVYTKGEANQSKACICEIKTAWIESAEALSSVFAEPGMKRFIKHKQMQNLHKFAVLLQSKQGWKGIHAHQIYMRIFIVIQFKLQDGLRARALYGPKLSLCTSKVHIYSWVPEFVAQGHRVGGLQIPIG